MFVLRGKMSLELGLSWIIIDAPFLIMKDISRILAPSETLFLYFSVAILLFLTEAHLGISTTCTSNLV